jgi:hypothetical protein
MGNTETGPEKGEPDEHPESEPEFSIARSNALAPLLILFAATILAIVVVVVRAKPIITPLGAPADRSFSPADFPMLFAKDEALTGLQAGDPGSPDVLFPVPAPPFTEGIFPCMECHATFPPDRERRPLEGMHSDIVFHHDAEHRWCLDCHDADDRNQLRLASGTLVPFTRSYELCGQCHGTQLRDWRSGIHGKRTGYWNGAKRYMLCVHCHNPHNPRFAALKPLPPPMRPQYLGHERESVATRNDGAGGVADIAPGAKEGGHAAAAD